MLKHALKVMFDHERRRAAMIIRNGMIKIFSIALVGLSATSAIASDLQRIRATDEASVFIDRSTLSRNGDIATVWSVWDHASDQLNLFEESYRSARLHSAYNCKERTVRLIEIAEYQGSFGRGNLVRSYPAGDSEPRSIPPGTVGEDIFGEVCATPDRAKQF
jgi:hypothetical protein